MRNRSSLALAVMIGVSLLLVLLGLAFVPFLVDRGGRSQSSTVNISRERHFRADEASPIIASELDQLVARYPQLRLRTDHPPKQEERIAIYREFVDSRYADNVVIVSLASNDAGSLTIQVNYNSRFSLLDSAIRGKPSTDLCRFGYAATDLIEALVDTYSK